MSFQKEHDESGNTNQTSNHLLNEEEKEEEEKRYNWNLAQNIKIKRLEKSYERASTCDKVLTDDEEEPYAGENNSSERQQLEFDLEPEDYLMLNHDVDDDNVDESAFALSTDHLRGKELVGNEGWNDGDDNIKESKVKTTTDSPKQNEPHMNERWNTEKLSVVKDHHHGLSFSHKERRRCQLCPISSTMTYTREAYRKHKAAIHDRKIVCLKCQRGFASASLLKRHLARRRPCLENPIKNAIKSGIDT